jgi:hypothetical protein
MDDFFGGLLGLVGAAVLGAAAIAGVIFIAKIAYDAIKDWIADARDEYPDADTVELVRTRLADGNYRVVSGIFEDGVKLESQTWEGEKLDAELKAEFGRKNKIVYDLTA